MKRKSFVAALSCAALTAAPLALACGEGHFNMGQGMRYQGYLAPRPAAVLVFVEPSADAKARQRLVAGLEGAGHRVTLASNPQALAAAMAGTRFDVVIADFARVDAIEALAGSSGTRARLVPVVDRSERGSAALRARFPLHVVTNASLGQYLKAINLAVAPSP